MSEPSRAAMEAVEEVDRTAHVYDTSLHTRILLKDKAAEIIDEYMAEQRFVYNEALEGVIDENAKLRETVREFVEFFDAFGIEDNGPTLRNARALLGENDE